MEKIKLGIIGLGRIGKIHYENLKFHIPGAEVVMVSDPFVNHSQNGVPCGSVEELIKHPDIQAVVICSPTDTHADYIEQSARAGKHIFCEKPHDLSLDRVIETLLIVQETGVKLMLGFNRRFDPAFQKIRKLVEEGSIGDPAIVKITSRDPAPPPLEYLKSSGGMFLDMTIHDFDMARFIMGKEVTTVYACGGVFTSEDVKAALDIDTAIISLTFEDGSMAVIDNCRRAVYGYDQRLEVFGKGGMAQADNNKHDSHLFFDEKGSHGALPLDFFMDRYSTSYRTEMSMFIQALQSGADVPVSGIDGMKAMMIALAANKSIEEGRAIRIEEIMTKNCIRLV